MAEKKESQAVFVRQEEPLIPDVAALASISDAFHKSGMWPQYKSPQAIVAVVEYGRELGIPPAAALNTMAVVNGRLTMEAKAMLAVANKRAGVTWKVLESTTKNCKMQFMRPGFEPIEVTFDEKDALAAGLIGKQNWKMYPRDMYFARCASRGVRQIAADAVLGLYSKEEMGDTLPTPAFDVVEAAPVQVEAKPDPVVVKDNSFSGLQPAVFVKETPEPKDSVEVEAEIEPEEDALEDEEQGPEPVNQATDEQKRTISEAMEAVTKAKGYTPEQVIAKLRAKLNQKFGIVEKVAIPDDLSFDEATFVGGVLHKTLYPAKATK